MTIITLHHLCFSHCVNFSVIIFHLGIFLRELRSLKVIIVINNRYLDILNAFLGAIYEEILY